MAGGGDYAFKFTESAGFRLCLLGEDYVGSINNSANMRNIPWCEFESTRITLLDPQVRALENKGRNGFCVESHGVYHS
jgi:hypothetical protein